MGSPIDTWFESRRGDLLDLLSRLVEARTENPPGKEAVAAEVVAQFFESCGIAYQTHEAEAGRTNIIGSIGQGEPTLLLAGHLDVVPAGDGWDGDPFKLRLADGKAIGRGVCDNKGPTAAMLLATRYLHERGDLGGTLLILGAADEERGSKFGLEWLLGEKLLAPDMAIVPDTAGFMETIDVAEKGLFFVEAVASGRQAHGSMPELGVNANWVMLDFLERLQERPLPSTPHRLFTTGTTLNLGMLEGGVATNMVPARCKASLDIRYPPGQRPETILDHLDGLAAETRAANAEAGLETRIVAKLPPTEIAGDHPLVTQIKEAIEEGASRKARAVGLPGATVAKQLIARGIPTVGFGPGDERQHHMANESIDVQELLSFAKVLVLAARKLLG